MYAPSGNVLEESNVLVHLPDLPVDVSPVHMVFRRRSSIEEVHATMQALQQDKEDLVKATANAERLTNVVISAADGMSSIAKRNEAIRKSGLSKARLRWIFAIRKVIIQLAVQHYTAMLAANHEGRGPRRPRQRGTF
jgi:endonuclease V-like protein UPF0215 family